MTAETPKIVRYERKPLTEEQIARLRAVANLPDDQIDFSDIPEADDLFFENGLRGAFKPVKRQITLRLDAGIIEWFKRKMPKGYQTEMNRVLLEHIFATQRAARSEAQKKTAKKKAG